MGLVAAACTGTVLAAKELLGQQISTESAAPAQPDGDSKLAQNTLPTQATDSPTASPTVTPTAEPTKASS